MNSISKSAHQYITIIILILLILIITGFTNKSGQPEWQKKYNDPKEVRTMFANPPLFYAPNAFWFWDDTIRDEHFAASMIDEMAPQGLNPGICPSSGPRQRSSDWRISGVTERAVFGKTMVRQFWKCGTKS